MIINRDIQIFSRISFLDRLLFTKHLSVMLKSGITASDAVEALSKQSKSTKLQKVLSDVVKDIKNGQSMAKSFQKHPKVFDQFYISLIEVGESSGSLAKNLEYLAKQLTKDYVLRKKIQGALLYPAIVLSAIVIIGLGLGILVLPNLVDLFSSLDVKLPLSTQILLFFANLMKNHGLFVVLGIALVILLLNALIHLPKLRPTWDTVKLSLPIFGGLLENEQLAALTRNIGIMLKSGLPLTKALTIQYEATDNSVFRNYIKHIQKAVDKGKTIEDELNSQKFSKFSPVAITMIGVGEKTGKLDETFLYLGDFFDDELDSAAKNLSIVLEPILLLFIGLCVGFVAFAIISPIYDLTGAIKR